MPAVQSTLVLYGFFELINGDRRSSPRRTNPSAFTYHTYYNTAVQCADESGFAAEFRIFSPPSSAVVQDGTVAFLNGRAFISPGANTILLEGVRLAPIPGNPKDRNYQKQAPDLAYAMAYGVGVVKTNDPPIVSEGEKSFTLETTDLIRDESQSSIIRCVMPAKSPRWARVPLPSVESVIFFDGICDGLGSDGILRFTLDHFLFSLNVSSSRATTSPVIPMKRERKFAAIPSPAAPAGPSSVPSDSQESPRSSTTAQSPSPLPPADADDEAQHATRSGKRRAL